MTQGTPLVTIDDSIQRATADQQSAQAEAAQALLDELQAQPRKENLDVARAQVDIATATLKNAQDAVDKLERAHEIEPRAVSKDALDTARNAVAVADTNLEVVERQYELTKAGAWSYDVTNQERQHEALVKAAAASTALLQKYTIRAPIDGIVLSIQAAVGSYVSPQGPYDTYTGGFDPVIVMGAAQDACKSAPMSTRSWCTSSPNLEDDRPDVHPGDHDQCAADVRPRAAVCVAQD